MSMAQGHTRHSGHNLMSMARGHARHSGHILISMARGAVDNVRIRNRIEKKLPDGDSLRPRKQRLVMPKLAHDIRLEARSHDAFDAVASHMHDIAYRHTRVV